MTLGGWGYLGISFGSLAHQSVNEYRLGIVLHDKYRSVSFANCSCLWGFEGTSCSMGCFQSSEAKGDHQSRPATSGTGRHAGTSRAAPKSEAPDSMLAEDWEYIKQLGTGGSGDTGLFRAVRGGEEVAIKLIKRPLPKVVMPNILREITVRQTQTGSFALALVFKGSGKAPTLYFLAVSA